jgi:uncharacterized protein (DUF4415 family)
MRFAPRYVGILAMSPGRMRPHRIRSFPLSTNNCMATRGIPRRDFALLQMTRHDRCMPRDDSRDRPREGWRDAPRARREPDARAAAEKAFKAVTTKPAEGPPKQAVSLPGAKETVTLRIDRDVLDFFQTDGAGWQDRINAALRKATGK